MARRSLTRIFTDTFGALFNTNDPDLPYEFEEKIRLSILLGANPTATGTLSRALQVDSTGRLRTDSGVLGTGAVVSSPTSWSSLAIGEWAWAFTGSIAGNAAASLPTVAPAFGESIFEVEQILHVFDAQATVATRVPTLTVASGMPSIVSTLSDWTQVGASSTSNENSKMFVPRGPAVVKINDNGTISDGATSPLPVSLTDGGSLSVTVSLGEAGDAHSLAALVRRVA
jgi:hypothetical protein